MSTGTDVDGDGYDTTLDCDDNDPNTFPGAALNGLDYTLYMTDVDGDDYGDENPALGVEAEQIPISTPIRCCKLILYRLHDRCG